MPRVHFRKENVTVDAPAGSNLRELCLQYGVDPYPALGGLLSCRGKGLCGTCAVAVEGESTSLGPPDKREARFLKGLSRELAGRLRLSCRCVVQGDVTVNTDPDRKEAWKKHSFYSGRPARSWEPAGGGPQDRDG